MQTRAISVSYDNSSVIQFSVLMNDDVKFDILISTIYILALVRAIFNDVINDKLMNGQKFRSVDVRCFT